MHAEGEKAHKNLGKSARTKKAGGGAMPLPHPGQHREPIPLPPRRSMAEEFEAYNPNQDPDLGSTRISNARGGVIGRKQAAAMAYKSKGMGMSNKMGIPKMKGMPNLAADVYVAHKKGGAAQHPDEAEDKKLMHKVLKKDAFKERAHKVSGGRLGDYIRAASIDAASQGTKRGIDKASQTHSLIPRAPMFPQAELKERNRLQGIRTAVNKLGGGYSKNSAMVPAGENEGMKKGGRAHKTGGGPIGDKTNPIEEMIALMHRRMDEMGYAPGSMKRGTTPGRAAAMATGSEDARIQGDQPNAMYNKRPNFTGRKDGGRAEKCWGGEAKRSKKFDKNTRISTRLSTKL